MEVGKSSLEVVIYSDGIFFDGVFVEHVSWVTGVACEVSMSMSVECVMGVLGVTGPTGLGRWFGGYRALFLSWFSHD